MAMLGTSILNKYHVARHGEDKAQKETGTWVQSWVLSPPSNSLYQGSY